MKRYNILFLSLLGLFTAMPVFAQDDEDMTEEETPVVKKEKKVVLPTYPTMEVKGICVDAATKTPLAGIMVRALGNANYTAMTDDNGEFVIKVPTFTTALYVHTPEYLSQQVGIGPAGRVLRIEMLPDSYRPMYTDQTDITAQASQSLPNTTSQTIETDIEGVLGADVRAITRSGGPGYGTAMFIRGLNSLTANAQPLIVVDGVIQDMQQTRTALHDGDYANLLLNINPEDIEKVTVLKNATALYGAKGGNGVILIDTKRGHSMATRIDANVGVGVSLQPRLPSLMNAADECGRVSSLCF